MAENTGRDQPDLFGHATEHPDGFAYHPDVVPPADEAELIARLPELDFRDFEFRGYRGKRRVASFGWRYDFNIGRLERADEMPGYLRAVADRAARLAGVAPADFAHVLVTEYAPGAAIGWHRDRPEFGDVVGVSLGASCRLRFRRGRAGAWERATIVLAPRSAYLLRGPAREQWEHSIPPVDRLRYSLTFRSLREPIAVRPQVS